jgi:hypothetical protein
MIESRPSAPAAEAAFEAIPIQEAA